MPTKDKNKLRKYRRKWYYKNKERQIQNQLQKRKLLLLKLQEYKRTLFCIDCGMSFKDRPECLDFHHLNNKIKEVSRLARYSEKTMFNEISKCIPLCANCHRTRHK